MARHSSIPSSGVPGPDEEGGGTPAPCVVDGGDVAPTPLMRLAPPLFDSGPVPLEGALLPVVVLIG